MNDQIAERPATQELEQIRGLVAMRLRGMLADFELRTDAEGLVLRGRSRTFYAKQLAQQIVMESTPLRIRANHIEVGRP